KLIAADQIKADCEADVLGRHLRFLCNGDWESFLTDMDHFLRSEQALQPTMAGSAGTKGMTSMALRRHELDRLEGVVDGNLLLRLHPTIIAALLHSRLMFVPSIRVEADTSRPSDTAPAEQQLSSRYWSVLSHISNELGRARAIRKATHE
ncbi:unnamed protein product, partial [Chrysoparadoxa australica]